jgi:lipopolysaccharide export LptBFGC system permease protein LptF
MFSYNKLQKNIFSILNSAAEGSNLVIALHAYFALPPTCASALFTAICLCRRGGRGKGRVHHALGFSLLLFWQGDRMSL